MEVGERVARIEQRIEDHQTEIIRLRDGHHEFREQLGINAAQLGSLASEVKALATNTEFIAERAATKVLNAWLATQQAAAEQNERAVLVKGLLKAVLLALLVAGAAVGLKASGLT